MARTLPPTDAVIIGLGWAGSIIANELTDAGMNVVAIERGPWRDTATDFNIGYIQDELRYAIRQDLLLRPAQETFTFRNTNDQTALPIRQFGSFQPGNGVGGASVHWNGMAWRFNPTDFRLKSHLAERYGAAAVPEELSIQDWGVGYDELEPSFDRFEYLAGVSGKAGNIRGQIQDGGNPFEGPRAREYPLPPLPMTYAPTLFAEAARSIGHKPFPIPAANASQAYTNPLGVTKGPCTFCGFCERFGCANYSKASVQTTVLPVLVRRPNFTTRTECEVLKVDLAGDGRHATGVTYVDSSGEEWFQPAGLVVATASMLDNVRLMLLSGIGTPYDPRTGQGVVGRNYACQTNSSVSLIFDDKILNPFIAAGALGQVVDAFNGDNFDHSGLGFVGGAAISCNPTGGQPIGTRPVPPLTPRWGSAWKKATAETYLRATAITTQGSGYAARGNRLDLDPTYTDRFGRPLLRITFDYPANDLKMSAHATARAVELAQAMKPRQFMAAPRKGPYSIAPNQATYTTGGAIMGADPTTSAVNRYLQSWDVPNVFVVGASAFPQTAGYNPTGTAGALAFWAAEAIRTRYLKSPGPLVQA